MAERWDGMIRWGVVRWRVRTGVLEKEDGIWDGLHKAIRGREENIFVVVGMRALVTLSTGHGIWALATSKRDIRHTLSILRDGKSRAYIKHTWMAGHEDRYII